MVDDSKKLPPVDPEAAHLDAFRAPDLGEDDDIDDDIQHPDDDGVFDDEREPPTEVMGPDEFWIVFSTAFSAPAIFVPDFAPMAIQPEEEPPARAASDAAHALLSIYYPKALMPFGETAAHLMILGPFLLAKAMVVRSILEARNQPQPRDVTPPDESETDGATFTSSRNRKANGPTSWMDAEAG